MKSAAVGLCAIFGIAFTGIGRAADGDWAVPGKENSLQRFSGLDQINTQNVAGLKVAWTFSVGVERGQESAPIVADGTLFLVTPYPHKVYALDLSKEGGALKWQYDPKPDPSAQGVACCDTVNRGPTFDNGTIYFTTLDTHVVALDAATGAERWKVKLGNINQGETMTMAPLVVRGKVIVGNSGGEYGVRGWLQALAAASGKPTEPAAIKTPRSAQHSSHSIRRIGGRTSVLQHGHRAHGSRVAAPRGDLSPTTTRRT
jgi:glucose dehydrogenase